MYKKNHPQTLIISIWIFTCIIMPLLNKELIVPAIIFLIFGLIGLFFNIFVDSSIQMINIKENDLYIKYKKGLHKEEIKLKKEEIQKLVFNFYIRASSKSKASFYNYVSMDVVIILNNGQQIQLHDDYIMNGFVWHVGKNFKQIDSIKTLVNMFKEFEKFSYNIKNVHAIYDKRYEPEAIKAFINI